MRGDPVPAGRPRRAAPASTGRADLPRQSCAALQSRRFATPPPRSTALPILAMASAASTAAGSLKGAILGLGNPLLDISAETTMDTVTK